MTELTISEILRGLVPGRLQSVGLMQVIPLTCTDPDLFDQDLVSPMHNYDAQSSNVRVTSGTTGYGAMQFKNPTDKVLLVPCHVGYVTKHASQDHAMATSGLVAAKKEKIFENAMCIQQRQGGLIPLEQHKMLILPYSLRECALAKRSSNEFSRLWEDIDDFNKTLGIATRGGHLEYFMDAFKEELDQFVAEFEIVPGQTGAIILVNGSVVGVERAPSPKFWSEVWDALIRECYGSLAIEVSRKTGNRLPPPSTRTAIDLQQINTLDDLEKELQRADCDAEARVKTIVRDLLEDPFKTKNEGDLNRYNLMTLENGQFNGQVVRESQRVVYASLFTTKSWAKNAPWMKASKFAV
jgi:hypothetical protein